MLVVGDKEVAEGSVAVRARTGGDQGSRPLDEFVRDAVLETQKKSAIDNRQSALA
jgi:threonyl-tRNA synthetase